jgi:5-methylthioadenosine/S-adenosylhomocysteine deaminase
MSLLIRNVLLEDRNVDILIQDGRFARIAPSLATEADVVLDGSGKAVLPSFVNGHTHAAMTLLRGYADDMELNTWLTQYIWPLEAELDPEDVYIGSKLACLEMIKTGTTFFNDMYWYYPSTARAVEEMGVRAALSSVFIDFNDPATARKRWEECIELFAEYKDFSPRITFALGPHAVYSVSRDSLCKARDFAQEHGLQLHIHLSETRGEVEQARETLGCTPGEYLHQLGMLGPNLCACHCVWPTQQELDLFAEHGVKVVHNPVSNLKLCSGRFPYPELRRRGITVGLGTDGCSSNNNLDMLEEMKFAALMCKDFNADPTVMPAQEAFAMATSSGSDIFGLQGGRIEEGAAADCILVDLSHPQLVPDYNLISNLVYAANGDCVDTTICDGRILMQGRQVEQEEEIIGQARERAARLVRRQRN